MAFDLQIAHSVKQVGQEAWDRLSGRRPFASYHWYRYSEEVMAGDTPVYIILSHRGEPVARATFWLKRRQPLPIPSRIARRLIGAVLRRRPLLLCEAPLVPSSGLILPSLPLREAAVEAIAQVAQQEARRHRASFLGCVYLEEDEARCAGWPDAFAAFELPEPGTTLTITWPDFESYLKHLSKSMRKDYRRHRNRARDLGFEIRSYSRVAEVEKALALARNVEGHHGSEQNPWARAMLENAGMIDAVWLAATTEERLVACGLLLGDNNTRVMSLLGLDYDVRYAYFQLIYAAIQHVIEEGAQALWGGAQAYGLKQRLGFQLTTNNYIVFAGRGALLQKLGRWVARGEESRVADSYEG